MFKHLLAFVLVLVSLVETRAQQCNSNVSLYTQADVDAFASYNLSVINGSLTIQAGFGGNITNLNALSSLTRICGDLRLIRNTNLISLAGLNNITSVGGNLVLDYNSNLTDLAGLNKLQTIGGSLSLFHNDGLTSLNGLGSLVSIGGTLGTDNSNLRLSNFTGLTSLESIRGGISISGANFMNLQGLNRIKSIGGGLTLDAIRSFSGLDSLSSINGNLAIINTYVDDLIPLSKISGIQRITIQGNPNLSICHVNSICDFLKLPTSINPIISSNKNDCNSRQQILTSCNTITATDNQKKESEQAIYPNPTSEYIIRNSSKPYIIYNTLGKVILQGNAAVINIYSLTPGMYYLEIAEKVMKFVKE